jgi:hypothetical protein
LHSAVDYLTEIGPKKWTKEHWQLVRELLKQKPIKDAPPNDAPSDPAELKNRLLGSRSTPDASQTTSETRRTS